MVHRFDSFLLTVFALLTSGLAAPIAKLEDKDVSLTKRADQAGQDHPPPQHHFSCSCLDCKTATPPSIGLTWSSIANAPFKVADAFYGNLQHPQDELKSIFQKFRGDKEESSRSCSGGSSSNEDAGKELDYRKMRRIRYLSYNNALQDEVSAMRQRISKWEDQKDVDTSEWKYECEPSVPTPKMSRRRSSQTSKSITKP